MAVWPHWSHTEECTEEVCAVLPLSKKASFEFIGPRVLQFLRIVRGLPHSESSNNPTDLSYSEASIIVIHLTVIS